MAMRAPMVGPVSGVLENGDNGLRSSVEGDRDPAEPWGLVEEVGVSFGFWGRGCNWFGQQTETIFSISREFWRGKGYEL